MILPAISVRPPWSHFISRLPRAHAKTIENRPRRWHYRGPLLIHAGKTCSRADYESAIAFCEAHTSVPRVLLPRFEQLDRGGIVGAVRLAGVLEPDAFTPFDWHMPDSFGLQLEQHMPLPFRAYPGALGLFRVELTQSEERALTAGGLLAA
jgi:hypothetical protein